MALKRKAAVASSKGALAEALKHKEAEAEVEDNDIEEDAEMEEVQEETETREEKLKREAKEWATERPKELKSMYMDALKKLAEEKGVASGKKEDMIKLIMKAEAKEREEKRVHEEKIRGVIEKKSQEFQAMDLSELKQRCGLKGRISKSECIQHVLKAWQDADGVDKALKELALKERHDELAAKDSATLLKQCDKAGIDPYVLEVMVDRILEHETRHDKYAPPKPLNEDKPIETAKRGTDLVEALLASEANRKRELELEKQKEASDKAKIKEINAMPLDALQKMLKKKGHGIDGKKEDLVKFAFKLALEEEATDARSKELKAMGAKDLKQLLASNGLDANGKVGDMVEAQLKYEKRVQEEFCAYEAKVKELTEQKKEEYAGLPLSDLKQLLAAKGLKIGTGKAEGAQRLAEEAQKDGTVSKKISQMTRAERRQALLAMDKSVVLDLCHKLEIDPLMKDVAVQRLISHETDLADGFLEPEAKKARTGKK